MRRGDERGGGGCEVDQSERRLEIGESVCGLLSVVLTKTKTRDKTLFVNCWKLASILNPPL